MAKIKWPEEVRIPSRVGSEWYSIAGRPVCAIGHACDAFHQDQQALNSFRYAYRRVAKVFAGPDYDRMVYEDCSVEHINDNLKTRDRTLLYNATMAYLGYTEGQDKEALKLARKAKRNP